jgi:hypothetical protein
MAAQYLWSFFSDIILVSFVIFLFGTWVSWSALSMMDSQFDNIGGLGDEVSYFVNGIEFENSIGYEDSGDDNLHSAAQPWKRLSESRKADEQWYLIRECRDSFHDLDEFEALNLVPVDCAIKLFQFIKKFVKTHGQKPSFWSNYSIGCTVADMFRLHLDNITGPKKKIRNMFKIAKETVQFVQENERKFSRLCVSNNYTSDKKAFISKENILSSAPSEAANYNNQTTLPLRDMDEVSKAPSSSTNATSSDQVSQVFAKQASPLIKKAQSNIPSSAPQEAANLETNIITPQRDVDRASNEQDNSFKAGNNRYKVILPSHWLDLDSESD